MLHYIDQQNIPHRNLYLIFGTRTQKDLLYYKDIQNWRKRFRTSGFSLHYQGKNGLATKAMCMQYMNSFAKKSPQHIFIYVDGSHD
jgi:NAD(P)H-flavin reductase